MLESVSPSKWGPDEIRRFYRGYHKYGSDFYKISKMVGGGKAPEMCAALWRRHQAYLSLDKKFQSEVAFLALVQDGGASHEPVAGEYTVVGMDGGLNDLYGEDAEEHQLRQQQRQQQQHHQHNDDLSDAELAASLPQAGLRRRNLDDEEDVKDGLFDDESLAAAAVVAMASPEKHGAGGDSAAVAAAGGTLAATRARRTPKRGPASATKRKADADDDIYAYYDEGNVTESAKKRRQARQRLNFDNGRGAGVGDINQLAAPGPGTQQQQGTAGAGRGYTAKAEKGGIDALLALAVAETSGEGDGVIGGGGDAGAAGGPRAIYAKGGYYYGDEDQEEEEEEDDVLGVMMDDDKDEDYKAGRREGGRNKRTPHSTPHKSRSRPASAHNTPHRIISRGFMSPGGGFRSPSGAAWSGGAGGGEMDLGGGDFLGLDDLPSYLQSPGVGGSFLPGGMHHNYVASPQNPMPRLRRRKHPPEKHALLISPLKTLLGRRHAHQALGGSAALMAIGGVAFPGQTPADDIPVNASAAELRIRHAMSVKLRKFCTNEFFYSGIDRPWYLDTTMTELVQHVGLLPGTKLTRKEWSALRSALGRPRRLSNAFLRESRTKLEIHRKTTRNFYSQDHMDPAIAATLPRQVAVGQKVIARHPLTRQLHDGTVLTAGFNNYRIQFYRRDLGVEMVRDIDVMPSEPWDNLPMSLLAARPRMVIGGRLILNGRAMPGSNLPIKNPVIGAAGGGAGADGNVLQQHQSRVQQQQPPSSASMQQHPGAPRGMPDSAIMAEVATNLDRKEALLAQLRQMNEDACSGNHNDPGTGEPTIAFTQAYTSVVMKLVEVNELLQGKLQVLERSGLSGGTGAVVLQDELARADGVSLPPELMQGPITKSTLSNVTKNQAATVTQACRQKIEQSRRDTHQQQRDQQQPETVYVSDAHLPTGAVAPLIEGATWTLSLLQLGADRVVPASALVSALETAILDVKPAHVVNAVLYTEIEAVMDSLKQQLLASF
jgi:DIRP/Myb-like DNA-binding domain